MKKFFRKLFGIKTPTEKAVDYMQNLALIVKQLEKAAAIPERDEKGRWIYGDHPSARKLAALKISKSEDCCGGEGCKCKKSNN
jgi:hypothetical protein